jgi:hypothetical protein
MFVCHTKDGYYFATGATAVEAFDKCAEKMYDNDGERILLKDVTFIVGAEYTAKLELSAVKTAAKKPVAKKPVARK